MRRIMLVGCAIAGSAVACADAGGSPHAETGQTIDAATSTAPGQVGWIASNTALRDVRDHGDASALVAAYFDDPRTFDITPRGEAPVYRNAVQTSNFTAVHPPDLPAPPDFPLGLIDVLAAGCDALDPGVAAVLVDLEHWDRTPAVDQAEPVAAYRDAAVAVASFNRSCPDRATPLRLVCTPGTDLVAVVDPDCLKTEDQSHCFIDRQLAARIAPSCDVYEIQSQSVEQADKLAEYVWYVEQAAAQARSARPDVALYAGLALSGVPGPTDRLPDCSPDTLFKDVLATLDTVSGYWLNEFSDLQDDACDPEAKIATGLLARMSAPRLVQEVGATESPGAGSLTVPISTRRGDLLVLAASLDTGSFSDITGVTDSAGNAWTKAAGSFISGHNSDGELWYTAGARPVSWVRADMAHSVLAAASVLELVNVSAPDVTASASGNGADASSGPAAVTSQATELWVAMIADHDASPIEFMSPGWTALPRHTSGTGASVRTAYRVGSATASPSIQASLQDAGYWTAIVATFQ